MNKANNLPEKIQNPAVELIHAITGTAVSTRGDLIKDASHIVQSAIQGHLLDGLAETYKDLVSRGKIKTNYQQSNQFRQQASYIFGTTSPDGAIDEKRFMAMQNIFINSAKEDMSNRDDALPIELMRICSTLNMGDILVLEAASRLNHRAMEIKTARQTFDLEYNPGVETSWFDLIAKESGMGITDMVKPYEKNLMNKGLFNDRTGGGQIVADTNYHLSGMGLKLCEFIKEYEVL